MKMNLSFLRIHCWRFLTSAIALTALVHAVDAASEPLATNIAFTLVDGRILVDVKINGRGPFRMIFDSGASAVLSPEAARDLRLEVTSAQSEAGTGAAAVETAATTVSLLQIGGMHLQNLPFDIISMRDMPPVFGTVRIDGIIGRPVFDLAVVTIDYDNKALILTDPQQFRPANDDVAIPFTRIRDVPLIAATLDGHPGSFGIDLGARSSLILTNSFAAQARITEIFANSSILVTGWGLGGPIKSKLARAHAFEFGGFDVDAPLVRLSVQKSGLLTKSDIAGLIGADILRQFKISIDPLTEMVYLHRSKQFGRTTSFDQSGMWLVQGRDTFDVFEVVDGGPAALANIRVGDHIMTIDDRSTRNLILPELRERWADARVGTKVRLHFNRDGLQRNTVVTLAPLV